jgi:hypothetical protein
MTFRRPAASIGRETGYVSRARAHPTYLSRPQSAREFTIASTVWFTEV